jgi:hypothetical protein
MASAIDSKRCGHESTGGAWLCAPTRPARIARLRAVTTTPDESISAQAGLAHEPAAHDPGAAEPLVTDGSRGPSDVESAPPDAAGERLAGLPDEPGEEHVAAYAAAADELAQRLDGSGTGRDDGGP